MAFNWSKTNISPIAVDFGADRLKLLQVIPGNPPKLVAAAAAIVPEAIRSDAGARRLYYADRLKELLRVGGFKGRRAICSLPAYQTLTQQLQVTANDGDFDEQVAMQLRHRLNVDSTRMVVRNFRVGESGTTGKQEVICIAAGKESVMRLIGVARQAKLDVIGMHCEPYAILKAFEHLFDQAHNRDQAVCFIDLGAATTKILIAHGHEMVFAKTIHVGGDTFTRQVADARDQTFMDARRTRIESVDGPGSAGDVAATAVPASAAAAAAEGADPLAVAQTSGEVEVLPGAEPITADASETMECLIDELKTCMRYHASVYPDKPVSRLVFVGGESRFAKVCQQLARALGIGAQAGDPLARMATATQVAPTVGVDLRRVQPGWAVPMGLCLSEANL